MMSQPTSPTTIIGVYARTLAFEAVRKLLPSNIVMGPHGRLVSASVIVDGVKFGMLELTVDWQRYGMGTPKLTGYKVSSPRIPARAPYREMGDRRFKTAEKAAAGIVEWCKPWTAEELAAQATAKEKHNAVARAERQEVKRMNLVRQNAALLMRIARGARECEPAMMPNADWEALIAFVAALDKINDSKP